LTLAWNGNRNMDINALLQLATEKGASDLHLVVGCFPVLRINGVLTPIESVPITQDEMTEAFIAISSEDQHKLFSQRLELDFAHALQDGTRFRVNACKQQGGISLVCRVVHSTIPSLEEINVPVICKDLIIRPNGLVVLAGPTGCGKSTTLAAMIEYLNQNEKLRVITIEDPIEYTYINKKCVISQRQVGLDTLSFAVALKHALRQDPDVILVGEMRDLETASMVLMAAETGHLVLSTGHASSAPMAIERIVDLFPTSHQTLAQTRLAAVLQGVLCQALLPRADGHGRVPAVEIMLANSAVRNLVREGKTHQLQNVIQTSQQIGMCTLDDALIRLYNRGLVAKEEVLSRCVNTDEVSRMLKEPQSTVSVGRKTI
jgi:twitching motility protein PilT